MGALHGLEDQHEKPRDWSTYRTIGFRGSSARTNNDADLFASAKPAAVCLDRHGQTLNRSNSLSSPSKRRVSGPLL
jgi:hypothetical protein